MSWGETIRTGLAAIRSHAMRSVLTIVGILIGIAAVILTVGLGLGTQKDVSESISSLGSNLLIVRPGSVTSSEGIRGGFGSSTSLTLDDAAALGSAVAAPDIADVAAEASTSVSLENGDTNWTTTVTGTTTSWPQVRSRTLLQGEFFSDDDAEAGANVIVLGSETAAELFGSAWAAGRSLTIDSVTYEVIGVLAEQGSSDDTNLDDLAVVPMATYSAQISTSTTGASVQTIYIQATAQDTLSAAYQEAETLLLNLHGITDASAADFSISSQDALVSTATAVYRTLTVLLVGIAAIALLVGGIGVMNIMLVSVTERTREIGLRKALGAKPFAIRRQFLVEATTLGLVGGVLGVGLGVTLALALPTVLGSSIVVSWPAVFGALAVAVGIGVVFGVYPATRAAKLAPVDALRAE
ncbi:MAG: ABC transporter permease [Bifidobacteriaceae bacterium]|jgi:putative ABC transport system permease protein|nr:ABC transporter permease [Bifidobacteriaceae bacterium]